MYLPLLAHQYLPYNTKYSVNEKAMGSRLSLKSMLLFSSCIIRGKAFYFAAIMPICAILVGNFVVLVLVMRGINASSKVRIF